VENCEILAVIYRSTITILRGVEFFTDQPLSQIFSRTAYRRQNNELLQLSRTTKKKTEKERGFSLLFFRPVN
jgi:hypothetical protein